MGFPVNSPFSLSGRRILVTGAGGGIGSATARLCIQHGADVVLADVLPPEAIAERTGSSAADCYGLDISDRKAVFAFAAALGADLWPDRCRGNLPSG